jgi:hypothetical protein
MKCRSTSKSSKVRPAGRDMSSMTTDRKRAFYVLRSNTGKKDKASRREYLRSGKI